jgi:hypothetical protein
MAVNYANQIREHMMVHARGEGSMQGVPGVHVGTVDYLEGNHIVLTKNDSPDGQHHMIPIDWVEKVEGNTVFLNCDADKVYREWQTTGADRELDRNANM